jgi:hypothetical protein
MVYTPILQPCALPTGPIPRVSCWPGCNREDDGQPGPEAPFPPGLVLVTDAVPALGLGNGRHTLGQQEVEVDGLTAYVAGE